MSAYLARKEERLKAKVEDIGDQQEPDPSAAEPPDKKIRVDSQ